MSKHVYVKLYRGLIAVMLVFLVAVIVMVMSGFYLFTHKPLPQIQGALAAEGLEGRVTIVRDRQGAPHITAGGERDLFLALGYAQAQDRLFQMDLSRRAARGRLGEWQGEKALAADRLARMVGFSRLAQQDWESAPGPSREALAAFAQGVNAFIAERGSNLPIEYKALGEPCETWRPEDSLAIALHLAFSLSANLDDELLRWRIASERGPDEMWKLLPRDPGDGPFIFAGDTGSRGAAADFERGYFAASPSETSGVFSVLSAQARLKSFWAAAFPAGSNGWVVDGTLTQSGKPLLAGDPHLGLTLPAVWHLVHLSCPGFEAAGAAIPGIPALIIGRTRDTAWTVTASMADVIDLFAPGPDAPITETLETIKVRAEDGSMQEHRLAVRLSSRGPLIDLGGKDPDRLALSWSGQERIDVIGPFLAAARSRDFETFRRAGQKLGAPSFVWLYADSSGQTGGFLSGLIPARPRGDGSLPGPAGPAHGWQGFIPRDELPRQAGSPGHFIVSANHRPVPPGASKWTFSADWPRPYRAERIAGLLAGRAGLTAAHMSELQRDTVSPQAQVLLPTMLEALKSAGGEDEELERARLQLQDWDGNMKAGLSAPTIFTEVRARAMQYAYEDEVSAEVLPFVLASPSAGAALDRAMLEGGALFDRRDTPEVETRDQAIIESFRLALRSLERRFGPRMSTWAWGEVNVLELSHPLADLSEFKALNYMKPSEKPLPLSGSCGAVSMACRARGGWTGQSLRWIVDLSTSSAFFALPGGQSGQPFSPHYADLLKLWHNGQDRVLALDPAAIEAGREARLELSPVQAKE